MVDYEVSLDRDGCIGCGMCENICPEVFKMSDDNKADVIKKVVPEDALDKVKEAAESCPVKVIKVSEKGASHESSKSADDESGSGEEE